MGAALALGLSAALVACGPRPERTLRLVYAQPPQSLDPQRHREDVTRHILAHFYEPLVAVGPGLEVQPGLAERWETPSERVWHLRLRAGVRFHDGTPFRAADVLHTLERAGRPESRVADRVSGITRVTALDERTVEIETAQPAPLLLLRLAALPILPRSAGEADITRPIGTGPYRFVSASHDLGHIEVERFEGYWGPAPSFRRAQLDVLTDEQQRWAAARAGADVVSPLPAGAQSQPGLRVLSRPIVTAAFVVCRLVPLSDGRASPVADLRVRQALARALDRRRLVEAGLAGEGVPLGQLVVAGVAGHVGQAPPAADLEGARQLLRAAGGPPPPPLELLVTPRRRAVGEELARQWAQLGLRVDVRALPWNEIDARMRAGQAALALAALTFADGDAAGLFEGVLHSPLGGGGLGGDNTSGYARVEFDELVGAANREMEPRRRQSLLAHAAALALADLPLIPLYQPSWTYAVRADLDFEPRLDFAVCASALRLRAVRP